MLRGGGEPARRRVRSRVVPRARPAPAVAPKSCGRRWPSPASSRCNLPEEYGGGGGGMSELVVVSEAAAAQGCPLLLLLVSAGISAELLARFGTDAQRARWLPGLCRGEKMVFAITEPDAGSNSHNLSTTATRDGDIYRLRGTKTYISGVDEAPAMLVVARTGVDPDTGRGELSLFVVDTDAPGLERTLIPVEISAAGEAVPAVLRRRGGAGRPTGRRRGRRPAPALLRPQPGTHPQRVALHRHRSLRARTRVGVRERARGVGRADRAPPGRRAPAGRRRRSSSSWRA